MAAILHIPADGIPNWGDAEATWLEALFIVEWASDDAPDDSGASCRMIRVTDMELKAVAAAKKDARSKRMIRKLKALIKESGATNGRVRWVDLLISW